MVSWNCEYIIHWHVDASDQFVKMSLCFSVSLHKWTKIWLLFTRKCWKRSDVGQVEGMFPSWTVTQKTSKSLGKVDKSVCLVPLPVLNSRGLGKDDQQPLRLSNNMTRTAVLRQRNNIKEPETEVELLRDWDVVELWAATNLKVVNAGIRKSRHEVEAKIRLLKMQKLGRSGSSHPQRGRLLSPSSIRYQWRDVNRSSRAGENRDTTGALDEIGTPGTVESRAAQHYLPHPGGVWCTSNSTNSTVMSHTWITSITAQFPVARFWSRFEAAVQRLSQWGGTHQPQTTSIIILLFWPQPLADGLQLTTQRFQTPAEHDPWCMEENHLTANINT